MLSLLTHEVVEIVFEKAGYPTPGVEYVHVFHMLK
jgi:hypothetical protein